MAKRIIKASIITVDIKNSEEDIKNGGSKYISHNFIVDNNQVDSMLNFIASLFNTLNIPYDYIYESRYVFVDKNYVSDKDDIYREVIKKFNCNQQATCENKLVLR